MSADMTASVELTASEAGVILAAVVRLPVALADPRHAAVVAVVRKLQAHAAQLGGGNSAKKDEG